jgi:hypothetical protein
LAPAVPAIADGHVADAAGAASLDADRRVNEGGTIAPDRAVATARSGGGR